MDKKCVLFLASLLQILSLMGCQKSESSINNTIQIYESFEENVKIDGDIKDCEEISSCEEQLENIESQEYIDYSKEEVTAGDIESIEKVNKNMIEEQSFSISLDDWGDVMFIACMPDLDESSDPLTDASFYLINNQNILYHFPDVVKNNVRESGLCEGVSFVLFEDINKDNKKDIIIGVKYISGAGPQGMIPYTEIRIFEAGSNEFFYNKSLSDEINTNLPQGVTAEYVRNLLID